MLEDIRRALLFGAPCGALSVIVFRDSTLFLLHHLFKVMPLAAYVQTIGWHGVPWVWWFVLWGALGGFIIGLVLRLLPFADLLTGAVLGVAAAYLLPQRLPAATPPWVLPLIGAAWGWGSAFLMRPLALRGRD
ncbi:hypothetical protein [Roseomonas populi]|uniref:Prepilin type IV endopeptidase peptidase domain-containing protein n=1 Tax=Roseomonas populi TaxID=3121582 RepID=A0ABT1X0U6_9PROT|nr:hypothetical protein [Roseomonas pecuniae]MCR0980584.1 hypothetical protein [Roseomonas pecuniae]